jgi:thioredoxin 1
MATQTAYSSKALSRAELDALPSIVKALAPHAGLRHLKIEDGPGRPLGRSFKVKLWPTLVVMRDGAEVARVVRPTGAAEIEHALTSI